MKLKVATCQFPVGAKLEQNLGYVLRQMKSARSRGAHVAHFSETALPGYAGVDIKSMERFDWNRLQEAHLQVAELARELKLWVVLGSAHRLSDPHKPHNSLYIIDDQGRLAERYDKMFLVGAHRGITNDLQHYTPGSHFCVFEIRGVRCGALICHDFRYVELYREYKKRGIELMFQSFHNARMSAARLRRLNIWGIVVPASMQSYAANNYIWVSTNNSSTPPCAWGSFFVRPDGVITGKLKNARPGVLVTEVDTKARFFDASEHWRDRALRGVYHGGTLVRDARSSQRDSF
jgi:predicted amidohydrolase